MLHVVGLCVSVLGTSVSCAKQLNRSSCHLGACSCWPKELCIRWGSDPPH